MDGKQHELPWWVTTDAAPPPQPEAPWWVDAEPAPRLTRPAAVAAPISPAVQRNSLGAALGITTGLLCLVGLVVGLVLACLDSKETEEAGMTHPVSAPPGKAKTLVPAQPGNGSLKAEVLPPKESDAHPPAAPGSPAKLPAPDTGPASTPPAAKPRRLARPSAPNPTVEKHLQFLRSTIKADQLAALRDLGSLGTAARPAVPAVLELLRRPGAENSDVADQAARTLAQIGHPAVPGLLEALGDPALAVRARALWAVGEIGPDAVQAYVPVCGFLTDPNATLRALATRALGEMGAAGRPAVPLLAAALRDPDAMVRAQAGMALRALAADPAIYVVPVTADTDPAVRISALLSLAQFPESERSLRAVVAALQDTDAAVRGTAALVLMRLGADARPVVPALLALLRAADPEVRPRAFTVLLAVGAPEDADFRAALTDRTTPESAGWAAPANRKETIRRALAALDDPNPTRRLAAVLALARLGPDAPEALPGVVHVLQVERNRTVLAGALVALTAIDPRQKSDGKTADMLVAEVARELRSAKKLDADELVRLYILASCLRGPGLPSAQADAKLQAMARQALEWLVPAVDELADAPVTLPALVRGLNATAEFDLGFTEPYARLSCRLRTLAVGTQDLPGLSYALGHLGDGVPATAALFEAVQQDRAELLGNVALLDWLIAARRELLEALSPPERAALIPRLRPALHPLPTFVHHYPKNHLIHEIWVGGRLVSARVAPENEVSGKIMVSVPTYHPGGGGGGGGGGAGGAGGGAGGVGSISSDGVGMVATHHTYAGVVLISPRQEEHPVRPQHSLSPVAPKKRGGGSGGAGAGRRDPIADMVTQASAELKVLLPLRARAAARAALESVNKLEHASDRVLIARLDDPDAGVRSAAVLLVGIKRLPAEKLLIALLEDPSPKVRDAAHWALVRLARGTDFGPNGSVQTPAAVERWGAWLAAQEAYDPAAAAWPPASKLNPLNRELGWQGTENTP